MSILQEKITRDKILLEDLEYLSEHFDFSEFFHSTILITGTTGLIGSQFVRLFSYLNIVKNADITILALIRNDIKAQNIFGALYKDIIFINTDIRDTVNTNKQVDYIIHCASETASKIFVEKPVETIDTAYIGTKNMLELAKLKNIKGFVYLSSMEVFGLTDSKKICEEDYGYIDILNVRSSYSESKRLCECLCACYAKEYNIPVKIARLAQVLGPCMDYNDTRVTAQFARCVIENQDIILKTDGKTIRPIVYSRDAVSGISIVLLKGKHGKAYTIANIETTASIYETANIICEKIANNNINIVFDIKKTEEYAPNFNLNLSTGLIESLGWKAEIGLEEAYRRMIDSMRNT